MSKCSVCEKKRAFTYLVGCSTELRACLYCVKNADCPLSCAACRESLGHSDGHDDKDIEAFCTDCHKGTPNLSCEKCGTTIGYSAKIRDLVTVFCASCMGKLRKLKKH